MVKNLEDNKTHTEYKQWERVLMQANQKREKIEQSFQQSKVRTRKGDVKFRTGIK
jgi:hypothetical protein